MVNATLPTLMALKMGHGIATLYVDQFPSIKGLAVLETSVNGTHYAALLKSDNTAYITPASTKLNLFAIDLLHVIVPSAAYTEMKLGYDDDGIGTNFVLLKDLSAITPFSGASLPTFLDIALGYVTVPAGKHLVLKTTHTATTSTTQLVLVGLETN